MLGASAESLDGTLLRQIKRGGHTEALSGRTKVRNGAPARRLVKV